MMRTETATAARLVDYAPYPFDIEWVDLKFDLHPDATHVVSVLSVTRKSPGGSDPLVLDGENITLLSVDIDGATLSPDAYMVNETALTLEAVPDRFELKLHVEIAPVKNTALSGLYMSGGRFCTQCEATGFRRITYWPDRPDVMSRFSVSIEADQETYPILLSNGSPVGTEVLDGGRHVAHWQDPHRKPSYLFALCAGGYDVYRDTFQTLSGRDVELAIHVDQGEAAKAAWAMDCLKRAMKWDEDVFGLEYDLDVFNIVAVRDFNFGAMENKGLNIFNSAYVLADEASATDADFEAIESIVAHEYFHNWTGNRITCRDWFQLCLKEGLTVFRDQEFSADMRSRPVQRIKDVIRLRARQFAEDAGPLAHPVRPSAYGAIDNLYTATVYEKGAELIRMLKRLIGEDHFEAGMDLYFSQHDGNAATIEDFYGCFEAVSGKDLSAFQIWYSQAGTPTVAARETWDSGNAKLCIHLTQLTPPTPGQDTKRPVPIPLNAALLDSKGGHVTPKGYDSGDLQITLDDSQDEIELALETGSDRPILSIARDFSAPIRLERELDVSDLLRLARAETDRFNKWDAFQTLLKQHLLGIAYRGDPINDTLVDAIGQAALAEQDADPAYAALLLRMPDVGELFQEQEPADPVALRQSCNALKAALSEALAHVIGDTLNAAAPTPYAPNAEQAGQRAFRACCMDLAARSPRTVHVLPGLFADASCMTEQQAALSAILTAQTGVEDALTAFYHQWQTNPIVIDKWFAVQARSVDAKSITELSEHPDFDLGNPNRVRAVAGVFAMQNLAAFHAPDGAGHAFLANIVRKADGRNPALAARLLTAFEQWRKLEPMAKQSAEEVLNSLAKDKLSPNADDIIKRALG